eukprot:gene13853-23293_t
MVMCNVCKQKATPQQGMRVTLCGHLFCNQCFQRHFARRGLHKHL